MIMKILVVSDTHGRDENLDRAIRAEKPFDMLIHCGDVEGREDYIRAVADAPVYMVRGNNDFFSDLPSEENFSICGKKAFLTHGHYYGVSWDTSQLREEARDRGAELVFFGHSHRPVIEGEDVIAINPGSLSYPRQDGRKPSYVVMNLEQDGCVEAEIKFLER